MGVAADSAAREAFMRLALEQARRGMAAGGPPIGACIVRNNDVVAATHNSVVAQLDVTAHAEVQALRHACKEQRTLTLAGADLYVTLEPCLMCLTACHYAGITNIYYGAPIAALDAITGNEVTGDPQQLFAGMETSPALHPALLAHECDALIQEWASLSAPGAHA